MSDILILGGQKVEKSKKTKWVMFCGTPCRKKKYFFYYLKSFFYKSGFSREFSAFYGQRTVTAAWATRSPWSIIFKNINKFISQLQGVPQNITHFVFFNWSAFWPPRIKMSDIWRKKQPILYWKKSKNFSLATLSFTLEYKGWVSKNYCKVV